MLATLMPLGSFSWWSAFPDWVPGHRIRDIVSLYETEFGFIAQAVCAKTEGPPKYRRAVCASVT